MGKTEQTLQRIGNISENITTSSYFRDGKLDYFNVTEYSFNITKKVILNETLGELNFRYAQTLLPFALILGLFCFIGIVGNSVVIVVFSFCKEYRNTNFKVFVLSLAVVDLLSCVTLMPAEILKTRHYFSISDHTPCKVKCFFNMFAMNASACILLVICIDRYRKVCQPLKKQIWPKLAIKILIGIFILSLVLSSPAPIMCGVTEHLKVNLYNANVTVFVCAAEKKYHGSTFRYIYKFGLSTVLVIIAVALIVMYVMIMKTVVRHWSKRGSGESVRFETNRSRLQSIDKLDVAGNEGFLNVKVEAHVNALLKVSLNGPNKNNKRDDEAKRLRSSSRSSLNSYLTRGRFTLKRSSSDTSFCTSVTQRHSSSAAMGRLPYKTLIWFILTLVFVITFIIYAGLSFMTTREHELSQTNLFWFQVFFRIYFINNIINPIIYVWLDKRFKKSCKNVITTLKRKLCRE
ncbi:cholecystokinin receptor type A-like [Mercenaria mercenaria]|uniref:cholecystokinin receptor type A-like n=1 Tax=Mercenaria mercenaria TaxID=6596 RepID=UPI00234F6030|nr:cholecystokinin receptor type A-like [Mercenaria mercenaria]XP_053407265.1 cholecystokinin receptor type A-like [Mercenaria mercenaria]XP_053407266.1 cholecystokinin receptor type A-like [Mercenaria mercenaria]XP_053407268.1 cholecystokinin receptor type A-like [Mercenaria mercenaria]XP_053407269.1 cholecystokinin receptor type A-like [Mercenaria mercenaria]XP_053407270.1 cholecystokinin receptor type A-like [Mercenaria mercenaria]XP_053407271.1 cholecystokinin receptor type A-like [Mercen